jgi:Domain of Unknown Function (DUF1259)
MRAPGCRPSWLLGIHQHKQNSARLRAVTGDFVLTGEEVNPVIKALRENGIEVTAIHSHMLTEQPRLVFMHFWANDDAIKLAKGLRAAVDKTASAKSWAKAFGFPKRVGSPKKLTPRSNAASNKLGGDRVEDSGTHHGRVHRRSRHFPVCDLRGKGW